MLMAMTACSSSFDPASRPMLNFCHELRSPYNGPHLIDLDWIDDVAQCFVLILFTAILKQLAIFSILLSGYRENEAVQGLKHPLTATLLQIHQVDLHTILPQVTATWPSH